MHGVAGANLMTGIASKKAAISIIAAYRAPQRGSCGIGTSHLAKERRLA